MSCGSLSARAARNANLSCAIFQESEEVGSFFVRHFYAASLAPTDFFRSHQFFYLPLLIPVFVFCISSSLYHSLYYFYFLSFFRPLPSPVFLTTSSRREGVVKKPQEGDGGGRSRILLSDSDNLESRCT